MFPVGVFEIETQTVQLIWFSYALTMVSLSLL